MLFDETIAMKKNKKIFTTIKTEFLKSKSFGTTVSYDVQKTQDFDKNEYAHINKKKDNLVDYFQKYDGNNLSYYIFPKLLYNDKFFEKKNGNFYLMKRR